MPHGEVVYRRDAALKPAGLQQTTVKNVGGGAPDTAGLPGLHDHSHNDCRHNISANEDTVVHGKNGTAGWITHFFRLFSQKKPTRSQDPEKGPGDHEPVVFTVSGMDCSSCGDTLTRALDSIAGVQNAHVNFIGASAHCEIAVNTVTIEQVIRRVEAQTRYVLTVKETDFPTLDIIVDGKLSENFINELPAGILSCEAATPSKTQYLLKYDPSIMGARKALAAVSNARLAPPAQDQGLRADKKRLRTTSWLTVVAFCLTIPVVVLEWADPPIPEHAILYTALVLGTAVQALAVPEFYRPALSSLFFRRAVDLDLLIVISISAAYGYSIVAFALLVSGAADDVKTLFETSTLLISLVLVGRLVAAYARKRAVAAVSMRSLQPTSAILDVSEGEDTEVDARLLEYGDRIVVRPHTYIVTDGVVSGGQSEVDESIITGEALPVPKSTGDAVVAGTLNAGGTLTIDVQRLPGRNTVTDIANLVDQAHATKPHVQDLADKIAGYFVPVVVTISVVVTIIWLVVDLKVRKQSTGAAIGNAITYGVAVLAVSCPCALGLAVPMVLVIAGGVSARQGVIIKTATATESACKVTDVVFDKTGTLTENAVELASEEIFERPGSLPREQILALVRALVAESSHPISKSISQSLQKRGVMPSDVDGFESIPGVGIECIWNGTVIRGGNPYWLQCDRTPQVSALLDAGLATFCVADSTGLLAVFGLRTTLRKEAASVIQHLQSRRNLAVHIVSGDHATAVERVARDLNVPLSQTRSRHSPQAKQEYIHALRAEGKNVLFCGDGTNDAVAVAEAHIGVQMDASSGSDITRASADVVLLGGLTGVAQLLGLSRAARRRIAFNFAWAAVYNVFAVLLAGGAFVRVRIPPAYAGLGELVSVLPVVLVAGTLARGRKSGPSGD